MWTEKHIKMLLSYILQNVADSDKVWCIFSWSNLPSRDVNVFHLTWIMPLHYLVKRSIHVLQLNVIVHSVKFEVIYTLAMLWFTKINSNINIYNINNNKTRKSNFWEFHVIHYISVLQKLWNVCLNVIKVTVTEKWHLYKIQLTY